MAIVEGKVTITKEDREVKDGNIYVLKPGRVFTRTYPCRPQVIERKAWKKFGEVDGVPRGKHKEGDFTQDVTVKIMTNDGEVR